MSQKKSKTAGLNEHSAEPLTEQSKGPNQSLSNVPALLGDIRDLIESAREQTARAVNSTLVVMYWQIGQRIRSDVLQNERAEYGSDILSTLSKELTWINSLSHSLGNRLNRKFPKPNFTPNLG